MNTDAYRAFKEFMRLSQRVFLKALMRRSYTKRQIFLKLFTALLSEHPSCKPQFSLVLH